MITSATNRTFIESEQYSKFILENMKDGLLPENFYRNVSDFGNGETLHIKSIGEAQIQFVEEDKPVIYTPIESGEITMKIDQYVGDAWYVTDIMRQDGAQIEVLTAMRAKEATRALQEYFETKALDVLYKGAKTAFNTDGTGKINGFCHFGAASGTGGTVELKDFIRMKLAFDKAEVPMAGRICIVDPVVGASLDSKFNASYSVDRNPEIMELLKNGFDRDHQYIMNLFGWNIISSNRLPKETITTAWKQLDGSTAGTAGAAVASLFMNIADDQTKSLMSAWRQQPKVEGDRNKDLARDEYVTRARFGFGVQRVDTLGVLMASDSNI